VTLPEPARLSNLTFALQSGHLSVLRLLCPVLSTESLLIKNNAGRTALSEAESRGTDKCLECAGYLLARMELEKWGDQAEEGAGDDAEEEQTMTISAGEPVREETVANSAAEGIGKLSLDERDRRPESTVDR
jgi:hypothetical protein